jgi:pyruvate,water dikinase
MDLAARRREIDEAYRSVELPEAWEGTPVPVARVPRTAATAATDRGAGNEPTVTGVPVSAGSVEGTARVALDPLEAQELEPGEILVCETTDPAWASVMMLSSALVIDIGGPLSHGAIVARELGIPCVIGTKDGTRMIATGDRIAVDGGKGEVRVLSRPGG